MFRQRDLIQLKSDRLLGLATGEPMALHMPLSETEINILRLVDVGQSNQEIAVRLTITVGTAKWHLHRIFRKLSVRNRTGAAAKARQLGLL
jgi:ATP/maltotriose-dependent transcriptional regulator MalT